MDDIKKKLKEIEDLNNEIENCIDDRKAILLQEKLVDLLLENFNNEGFLTDLAELKLILDEAKKK